MNRLKSIAIATFAFATVAAVAQNTTTTKTDRNYPKFEVPIGFSFVNVHPNQALITSFNVFGGGGGFVYNVAPLIGIKPISWAILRALAKRLLKTGNSWEM
jgi:hypothetical protein